MRLSSTALCSTVAVALFAGCSADMTQTTPSGSGGDSVQRQSRFAHGHFIPHWSYPASVVPASTYPTFGQAVLYRLASKKPGGKTGGLYAGEFEGSDIYGYPRNNSLNGPPTCSVAGVSHPNDIAMDGKGRLIDPDGGTRTVIVFQGPGMCGSEVGSISDPYGQPSDASSPDAVNGTIAVGNIFDNKGKPGSISICTMSGGCTANLTNSKMYEVAGVAMDNIGNCWASATNSAGTATLTYFAGCTGAGKAATGFVNSYLGGLDIDASGYLVSVSAYDSKVYVYSGCNPACRLVGGPYSLEYLSIFGHLNKQSTAFAVGDFQNGSIDVYDYRSPSALSYRYSFNDGLSASLFVEGAAYNPRSKQ
jgi:hypothetical protein